MEIPKFSADNTFYQDLKSRVNNYFKDTQQSQTGNFRLFSKAIFLIVLHIVLYTILVFFTPNVWISLFFCVLLGLASAAIGFNVMHDGSHGSFSKSPFVNKLAAFSLNVLGGNDYMWRVKHVILHHSFTNIDDVDDDIDIKPFMRMSPTQPYHKFQKFQHIYFVILYCFMYLFWMFYLDYKKYFSKAVGDFKLEKMSFWEHVSFWGGKLLNYAIFIVVPLLMVGVLDFLIGFSVFVLVTGFVISIVFQLAHTVEDTAFPTLNDQNKIENEWAIHQVMTTANFATRSRIVTWFCGGLNYQIEHHLFPTISHIHYPKISKIVKQACDDYKIKYIEFPNVGQAVYSHYMLLKQMSTPH